MGIFSTLEAKIALWALFFTVVVLGTGLAYRHAYDKGAASVQAAWDAQKLQDAGAVARAQAQNDVRSRLEIGVFSAVAQKYEDTLHAQPPSVADSAAAGVAAGTLRLRDDVACSAGPGAVSEATARSRSADAAATQALADRVRTGIEMVRLGDAADERERQLDAQILALQGVLTAERSQP